LGQSITISTLRKASRGVWQRVSFWTLKNHPENKGLRIQKVRPIMDA
jgi:thiamine phosphate synthase YjbQ (UPF0047 family)